jgi:hypothetical protein
MKNLIQLNYRLVVGRRYLDALVAVVSLSTLLHEAAAVCQNGCLTNDNTVLGDDALTTNTGLVNTAVGEEAMLFNTTGSFNTAMGGFVFAFSTSGSYNAAFGYEALLSNTTGSAIQP